MPIITSTLKVAGSTVNRGSQRATLQRLFYGIQGIETLDFAVEAATSIQGPFSEGQSVVLSMSDGTTTVTVFRGVIVSHVAGGLGQSTVTVGYHALGLRYLGNQVFTTAADGSGRQVYNLPHTDANWSQNLSGLSVGQILADYFGQHATQLTALGIAQPASADLTPLTVVPTDPVVMTGRIFDMADALLEQWGCGRYQCFIDPNTSTIRVVDTTALTAQTLTFGVDPIQVPSVSVDLTNCYTRTVLRGGGWTLGAVLSLSSSTLAQGWTSPQQTAWTINAFLYPSNSVQGAITSMTTGSVTADAFSGPVTTWATNYWSGAQIWVQWGFGSNYGGTTAATQYTETAEVISCTATSGGSATFTVDTPFTSTTYTGVEIHGPPSGESLVWRKYTIPSTVVRVSDGAPINLHLTQTFLSSYPWAPTDGVVVQATGPSALIFYAKGCPTTQQAISATFQVYPSPDGINPGYIVFDDPTVLQFSSPASLLSGTPDGVPCDIKVLLPYSEGALSADYPSSGYAGTAYSTYAWEQTYYRDYPNWVTPAQATNMGVLAQNIATTVQNAVIEGTCIYHGCPLSLMTLGQSLNLTGGMATGSQLATMATAIRNLTVEWPDGGGTNQVTQLVFSNQRKPYTGDSLFLHPISTRAASAAGDWSMAIPPPDLAGGSGRTDQGAAAEAAREDEAPAVSELAAGDETAAEPAYRPDRFRALLRRRRNRTRSFLATRAGEGKRAYEERQAEIDRARTAQRTEHTRRDPLAHRDIRRTSIDLGDAGTIRPSAEGLEPMAFTELPDDAQGGEELADNE